MGPQAASEPARLEGIADYTFVRFLGGGAQGHYFLAVPPARVDAPGEHVAVKVLTGIATDARQSLTHELRIFSSVRSPYLVTLLDSGQQGTAYFYAVEYHPLGSLAAPARELSRAETLGAMADAARGAHALHEASPPIVHRDIKPSNILLDEDGAKLSDLDLTHILSPGQTVSAMGSVQSVEFIDPQQIHGAPPSPAFDVWALGATLHWTLTGRSIYGELPADPLSVVRTVLNEAPRPDPSLRPGEAALIGACLDRNPAERPPSALAFAEEVDRLLAQT
ncbi:MAG: serine/threonine protein kinase [Actinomycetota bacterium]|nr:serine/threonine protein kinase [Actinomycetota bacterium]